jgi:Transposase DDE domain group 1/MaoC like domain
VAVLPRDHPDERVALKSAFASGREKVWARSEATSGTEPVVLDVDASLVEIHSERKEGTGPAYKGGFGFHPLLLFADATGEALSGMLRPGIAGSNTVTDHLVVTDEAIAQLPCELRAATGTSLGPSREFEIGQSRITAFASTTEDRQWIHLDSRRATTGPYGTTIAHELLTLSLVPANSRGSRSRRGRRDGHQLRIQPCALSFTSSRGISPQGVPGGRSRGRGVRRMSGAVRRHDRRAGSREADVCRVDHRALHRCA